MMCVIGMATSLLDPATKQMWVVNVPDELFMSHMAMYDRFLPAQLSDKEITRCKFLGLKSAMEYFGPYTGKDTK